jgi:ribosomal protein L37AE/L43A
MDCPYCESLSVSSVDKNVFHCSNCNKTFSYCEKCQKSYETKTDPAASHLCKDCKNSNF